MRRFALIPALVVAVAFEASALAEGTCLKSGSGTVSITGTLVQKVVPGPPNYRSVNEGDAPQVRWFVRLEASVCVADDHGESSEAPDVLDVRIIQLVLPERTQAKHPELVGRRVTASGFVSTIQTGRQGATVLLDVRSLDQAR